MTHNGLRILFNNDKGQEEQYRAIGQIQEAIKDLCKQHDIYQIELNITNGSGLYPRRREPLAGSGN